MQQLHLRLGIRRANRLGEAREPVDAGDEDVAQAAVLEVGQTGEPELGPFVLAKPQPQQLLVPRQIHA